MQTISHAGPPLPALDAPALMRLMQCSEEQLATRYLEPMREAMARAEINTPLRAAHWFAQLGHECAGLRYQEELASGEAYEMRRDLGNTSPGDGPRYKGHGLIQCTGKSNHLAFGIWMGLGDLFVREPRQVAENLHYAAMTAAWYWSTRKLNQYADRDQVEVLTRRINGGLNGLEDRIRRLMRAKREIGIV